jgi:two-component system response regulator BaeR
MSKIFIVEDEEKLANVLEKYIRAEGFETMIFNRGDHVVDAVRRQKPNLILLDIMLPGKSGIEICKELRKFSEIPIVMTTARVDEIDRLLGLELGADDYICKPFSPREVGARIKAILRRARQDPVDLESNNTSLVLDGSNYQATLDGVALQLTPIEFRILAALYGPPSRVLKRDTLMNHMYDDHRAVSDRTVDSHVANLRKKLKAVKPDSEYIQPVYGIGYRYLETL